MGDIVQTVEHLLTEAEKLHSRAVEQEARGDLVALFDTLISEAKALKALSLALFDVGDEYTLALAIQAANAAVSTLDTAVLVKAMRDRAVPTTELN